MCIAPFGIYIKDKYYLSPTIRNHERIHWEQQMEMMVVFFYLWYFVEWFIKLFIYGKRAYYNISFEREANYFECHYEYKRTGLDWINFL